MKVPILKSPSPKERKRLKAKCDKLWSETIKERAGWKCELAGKDNVKCTNVMQGAHLITRNVLALRHDLRNGRCLCSGHHSYYTFRPDLWADICDEIWREDWRDMNRRKRGANKTDLNLTFIYLLQEYEKITGIKTKPNREEL